MTLENFINILASNPEKALIFEYKPQMYAGSNYHLTEIKTVTIDSVDCGGSSHSWEETVFQLWENPKEIGKTNYLTTTKVFEIISKVNSIKSLKINTEVKIEYGNALFHTAQLNIKDVLVGNQQVIVQLHSENTLCKAPELCGVPEPKSNNQSCKPGSGCC